MLEDIAKGFYEGAKLARVSIAGGEVAQLGDMIKGTAEGRGFDLVGTCIGLVRLDDIIIGENLEEGDVIVGLESSGIHSNGLSLARKVLLEEAGLSLDQIVPGTKNSLGEELLRPTRIYVEEITEMFSRGLHIKALAHITGDGFLNLLRTERQVGYMIDSLPSIPPVFCLIQEKGGVTDEEMFRVFNMGIGFCVVVGSSEAQQAISIAKKHGTQAHTLGRVVEEPSSEVHVLPKNLIGHGKSFKVKT